MVWDDGSLPNRNAFLKGFVKRRSADAGKEGDKGREDAADETKDQVPA
jgi:hypothetical protein